VGTVSPNTVSGNSWTGGYWGAAGILDAAAGAVEIRNNTVSNNQVGIFCENGSATIEGNTVLATQAGTGVASYTGILCDPGTGGATPVPQPYDADIAPGMKPGYRPLAVYNYTVNGNLIDGDDGVNSVGLWGYCYTGNTVTLSADYNVIRDFSYGVVVDEESAGLITSVVMNHNSITSNDSAGVFSAAAVTANAEMNWWGSVSGPGGSGPGTGDAVYGPMDYDPWIGKVGGENIVCDPDPEYLNRTNATKTVVVKYLGGGGGLVYGYSVSFSWDSSKVTMNSPVTQGALLSDQGSTQFFVNGTGNSRTVDCVLMGDKPGVTGPGTMFTVSFTGIASGTSPIDITVVKVRDKNNVALTGFYEDDGQLVVDIVDPVVTNVFIDNRTLPHTDDYIKNGQAAQITATVTDDIGIGTIRANLTGLMATGGGSVPPDSIRGSVAYWNVASVTCDPANGTVMVTVTATDLRGNVGTGSDTITSDNIAPVAIANLAAVQQKSGNDGDGTTKIALTFTAAGDAYAVEVYRAGFGNYPEYSDPPSGGVPVTPSYVPPSPWAITGVTASGQKDEPTARDFWYYVAFVKDIAWNVSVVSNKTTGTLDYHLGDVAPGGTGDNLVNTADFSLLGGTYWLSDGQGGYLNYCDVGPTTDFSTNALPTTDSKVDFEDLMMFAMNFTTVSFAPDNSVVRFENPSVNLVVDGASGGVVRVHVMLDGNRQSVKGLHAGLSYNPAALEYVGVSQGSLVTGQTSPVFFEDLGGAGKVQVDLAAMLSTSTLRGSGEVAVVEFRVVGSGNTTPVLTAADLRDKANRALGKKIEPRQDDTLVSDGASIEFTFGAYPNPFKGTTEIAFSVPVASEVSLKVYDVNGRLVRSLVEGSLAAGSHRVVWDGRTGAGSQTAPGVYLAVVKIGDRETASKMFLLP
jgi:parallel beta-helix repeat protein